MFWMLFTAALAIACFAIIMISLVNLLKEYNRMADELNDAEEEIEELQRTIMSMI